jgi:hypothetical protein
MILMAGFAVKQMQVGDSVVFSVAVNMVYALCAVKLSARLFLHDSAVHPDNPTMRRRELVFSPSTPWITCAAFPEFAALPSMRLSVAFTGAILDDLRLSLELDVAGSARERVPSDRAGVL